MPEVISMTPKDLLIPNTTSIFQNWVPQSNNTPVSGQFRNYKYDSLSKTKVIYFLIFY